MSLRVFRQGDLTGLCGAYSVINAVNALFQVRTPRGFNEDLFKVVTRAIPRNAYPEVIWVGLDEVQLLRLSRKVVSHLGRKYGLRITASMPFKRRRYSHREKFFTEIHDIWQESISVFILWIDWPAYDGGAHWTVLKSIEPEQLKLADSDRQSTLSTKRLAVSGSKGTRLDPRKTIQLTLNMIDGERVR